MPDKILRAAILAAFSLTLSAQAQTRVRAWPNDLIRGRLTAIATGDQHGLALRDDGTVTAWIDGSAVPAPPAGLRDVVAIAARGYSSFAVRRDGTVAAWGGPAIPAGLTNIIAIADGIALRRDGTVADWGYYTPPAGLNGVTAIASGGGHHLALKSDGTVVGWGENYRGQATPPAGLSGVIAIAAGEFHSLALRRDGSVAGWGGVSGEGTPPPGLSGVVAIAAGRSTSLALKSDGTIAAWGAFHFGGPPRGLTGVKAIAASGYNSLALKNDGELVGGGWTLPPPRTALDAVAIAVGGGHSLAVKRDGTVVGWGRNHAGMSFAFQAEPPPGLRDVVAISAGDTQSIAVQRDGGGFAWGYAGEFGGLGALQNAVAAAAGYRHYAVVLRDGTVSVRGQAPQAPAGLGDVVTVSTGDESQTIALKRDGTVVAWPESAPAGLNNVVAIAGQLALRRDGTVVHWDSSGIHPTGLSDVIAISYGLALKRDGTVVGWPVNPPVSVKGAIAIAGGAGYGLAVVTLQGMVRSLVTQVESLGAVLHRGELNSLTQKLRHAEDSLNRGNSSAACGQLGAFDNEVQAMLRSGRLTSPQAAPLAADAAEIRSEIPCGN